LLVAGVATKMENLATGQTLAAPPRRWLHSTNCDGPNGGFYYGNNDAANSDTIALCPCTCAEFNAVGVVPQMDFYVDHLII